jgi:predicted ester cyclase
MRGTHLGELDGIAPTGKPVVTNGITIVRFSDGKVAEDWFESGSPTFQQQVSDPVKAG